MVFAASRVRFRAGVRANALHRSGQGFLDSAPEDSDPAPEMPQSVPDPFPTDPLSDGLP